MTKRPEEIAIMAESGRLLAQVFSHLDRLNLIGMSTMQVNDLVDSYIVNELQARPASKGQYGYAYALNSSRNSVVCHGVPSTSEVLQNGDIVNFDITLEKSGYIADSSKTYLVGDVSPLAKRLVQVTYEAMWKGIQTVRPGARLGDVGHAIERHARRHGYSVVREYCGHGIGREMHEPPEVLHWGTAANGVGAARRHGVHHRTDAQPGRECSSDRGRWLDGGDARWATVRAIRAHGGRDRKRRTRSDIASW